ncbi:putative Ig domain-containing protein [Larkinella insperata]|uniref:Ig domain-containing protein n=1 Tax=Larkinella insperata TaxID=332158 RepID=A0ABW3QBQ0_9BACT|nr:putative Ig domain-containing protein [Larkinella insperata]
MKNYISYLLLVILLTQAKSFAQTCPAVYEERNGLVVIETENLNLPSSWQRKTAASGYTGSGYIDWTGAENFNTTGIGLIETTIRINKAGRYTFLWRNKVGIGTVLTEHNDTWLRFPDASDFYGQGSRKVYPYGSGKTPNPNGAGSNNWFKVYFNAGTTTWAWATRVSDRESLQVYVEFDQPGVYKLQISARSKGHLLDRIVMHHSTVSSSTAQNLSNGETRCTGGTTPTPNRAPVVANAIPNQSATVGSNFNYTFPSNSFTDADGDALTYRANLTSGASLPSWLSFNAGSRTFSGTPPSTGTFNIRVTATDGRGGQATDDFTLTVNSGSTTPQPQLAVVSYSLINATTDQPIRVLTEGEQINLATLPTRNLNIRANTNPSTVGSVVMRLTGAQTNTRTETGAPYALYGDNNGNYHNWTPRVGSYTLTGTAYSGASGQGTAGTPYTLRFTVIDRSSARFGADNSAETAGLTVTTYPNPFVESFTISVKGREEGKLPVSIYDAQGRLVLQLADVQPDQLIRMDKNAPGLYLLHVGEGPKLQHLKLVKGE